MPAAVPVPDVPRPAWVPADLVVVAAGGAIGSIGRHLLGLALPADPLSVGVVVANLLGAAALGAAVALPLPRRAGLFWRTGVLGAFTTFSAMALQAVELGPVVGGVHLAGSLATGVAAAGAGHRLAARRPPRG